MQTIFREYDIRGIFDKELNEQSVKLIGYFLGQKIKAIGEYVSIGYDARTHSPQLSDWLTSGFNKAGVKVLNMGLVATPINYFSNYQTFEGITPSASVMITGSHNPPEYNGFKITLDHAPFFGDMIYALGDEIIANQEMQIEDNIEATIIDVKNRYIDYMVKEFAHLKGLEQKIILDCGNGVAGVAIIDICEKLELNFESMYTTPDGTFPNHHPDPSEEKNLVDIKAKLEGDFDLGFAYDGDADRIAVLTKKHNIKGDELALLFSKDMTNPTIIGEVKCSQVMYDEINKIGTAIMYKTGHSNLKVKIRETGADLAAEVSGHIFFNDRYFGYDDALYATFRVLELIKHGMDLNKEIEALPKTYSTEEIKVKTTEQEKFPLIDKVKTLLQNPPSNFPLIKEIIDVDGVRVIFEDGWGLVRASNTTPVIVTRFESTDEGHAKLYEQQLNALIQEAKRQL
ncbi:MAG: phosphomannomutase/phosphoglucomutase [Epsilonproteobacteria bacterium]|nr:phosphomannomutase/phosphoglucomutase [Campylobacterota bacterium]